MMTRVIMMIKRVIKMLDYEIADDLRDLAVRVIKDNNLSFINNEIDGYIVTIYD